MESDNKESYQEESKRALYAATMDYLEAGATPEAVQEEVEQAIEDYANQD